MRYLGFVSDSLYPCPHAIYTSYIFSVFTFITLPGSLACNSTLVTDTLAPRSGLLVRIAGTWYSELVHVVLPSDSCGCSRGFGTEGLTREAVRVLVVLDTRVWTLDARESGTENTSAVSVTVFSWRCRVSLSSYCLFII